MSVASDMVWYLQKRRQQLQAAGIEEQYLELLDAARKEREREEEEINELREKRVSNTYALANRILSCV